MHLFARKSGLLNSFDAVPLYDLSYIHLKTYLLVNNRGRSIRWRVLIFIWRLSFQDNIFIPDWRLQNITVALMNNINKYNHASDYRKINNLIGCDGNFHRALASPSGWQGFELVNNIRKECRIWTSTCNLKELAFWRENIWRKKPGEKDGRISKARTQATMGRCATLKAALTQSVPVSEWTYHR